MSRKRIFTPSRSFRRCLLYITQNFGHFIFIHAENRFHHVSISCSLYCQLILKCSEYALLSDSMSLCTLRSRLGLQKPYFAPSRSVSLFPPEAKSRRLAKTFETGFLIISTCSDIKIHVWIIPSVSQPRQGRSSDVHRSYSLKTFALRLLSAS